MKFIHEDRDFADLARIAGAERTPPIAAPLVEKDYWVTHTLWSLQQSGLACWFKGGTSLSKGFGLIERFSEDLDLKLGPGTAKGVPAVESWKSDGAKHVAARRTFFEAAQRVLAVSGATVELAGHDDLWRSTELRIVYPSVAGEPMPAPMKPFVLIEAGSARVTPSVERDLSSFVHDALAERGLAGEFADNCPRAVACVHPLVTVIEKLEAISRRFPKDGVGAASFVRHYEDAARVIEAADTLPPSKGGVAALVADMVGERDIRALPSAADPAFASGAAVRWQEVRRAYAASALLCFGPMLGLDAACARIRAWLGGIERVA